VLSSGWLPGATGKHVLGLFSALPPPECPSITPVGLLQVCLDHGSLTKSSCLPVQGECKHEEAQGTHADHSFKKFLSRRARLSPPKPAAKPGERDDI